MGWVWKERQSWRGSYRDEAGKQHTKSFKRQVDAKRWVATEESKVVRGDWIDPVGGQGDLRGVLRATGRRARSGFRRPARTPIWQQRA